MMYTMHYDSPLGGILLAADDTGLTGLWFDGQKYFANELPAEHIERETESLALARRWLDMYFTGKEPDFMPPLHPIGSGFRQAVWKLLLDIPYGQTTTYGQLARCLAVLFLAQGAQRFDRGVRKSSDLAAHGQGNVVVIRGRAINSRQTHPRSWRTGWPEQPRHYRQ